LSHPVEALDVRTTIAAACVLLFFVMTLLALYQIGSTAGVFRGGYLMMTTYYMDGYPEDRPLSYILGNKNERSEMGRALVIQDPRSRRFFVSKVGEELVEQYAEGVWIVSGVSQRDLFLYLRGMEIGIVATGAVITASILLPVYYDRTSS
jgi:hypothetical protein